jgi:hypothetical protein
MKNDPEVRREVVRLLVQEGGSARADFVGAGLKDSDWPNYHCRQLIRAGFIVSERDSANTYVYKLTPWGKKLAADYIREGDAALSGDAYRFATEELPPDFTYRNAIPPPWAFDDTGSSLPTDRVQATEVQHGNALLPTRPRPVTREPDESNTELVPNAGVLDLLNNLHAPCPHLRHCNTDWRQIVPNAELWQPDRGFVPCGFCGAFGEPEEVELVLVLAEPSNHPLETFSRESKGSALLRAVTRNSYQHLVHGAESHHRNLVRILDLFLGEAPLASKLRKTWITSSVLCAIPEPLSPTAEVPRGVEARCSAAYLFAAIRLFRNAQVVALGGKAQDRLMRLAQRADAPEALRRLICAMHPTARPANNPEESWRTAAGIFKQRKGMQPHRNGEK